MAKKCHTDLGEVWISTLGVKLDGAFTVLIEDSAGNFEGVHSGDIIRGTCTGTHITFRRPATNPRYEYAGKFSANRRKIKGNRSDLRKKSIRPREDEEWEATKTTTKLNLRPRRPR